MKADFLEEPELEFGSGGRHIDIRYGIESFGPLDVTSETAPRRIRLGMVGTSATLDGVSAWLQKCHDSIPGKPSHHSHLFPGFPGFREDGCFRSRLILNDGLAMRLSPRQVEEITVQTDGPGAALAAAVELLFGAMQDLVTRSRPDVVLCAIPDEFSWARQNSRRVSGW
ncbi:MAG: hypothetical protein ACRD3Q_18015 [Terriglobales bacterium]